jgi:hypothetical protein
LIVDFNNVGYSKQIEFQFSLENGLSKNGAVVLTSPVSLGISPTAKWVMHFPTKCSDDVWSDANVL